MNLTVVNYLRLTDRSTFFEKIPATSNGKNTNFPHSSRVQITFSVISTTTSHHARKKPLTIKGFFPVKLTCMNSLHATTLLTICDGLWVHVMIH